MAKSNSKNYFEAVGRRKTSVARVRLSDAKTTSITVNDKPLSDYFPVMEWREKVLNALKVVGKENSSLITVKVNGGGISSQADAIAHGVARAIILMDSELRKTVKKAGLLKRDPRMKERRKFGLKKARKAPQWSKR